MMQMYPILRSAIPTAGRRLTERECTALRRYRWPCSRRYRVVRATPQDAWHGQIEWPLPTGGYAAYGVRVTAKEETP